MKKYWRCFVCNDIHYGVAPPEICPTCKVAHAYIEISSAEARKIIGAGPERTIEGPEYRKAMDAFTAPNEFRVNPDEEKVTALLDGIFENEKNHGLKYCPCRLTTGDFQADLILVCPCNFRIHETYKDLPNGECWCGLYVRRTP